MSSSYDSWAWSKTRQWVPSQSQWLPSNDPIHSLSSDRIMDRGLISLKQSAFFFPFDLSQWYLYAWARWWGNLLTFFFFFSWVPSKGNLKAQGTFMKNKCVCMCVNSVCVQIGILQETNSEVSKIIILLLCLYFLSLQEYEEIVAYHLLLRNG